MQNSFKEFSPAGPGIDDTEASIRSNCLECAAAESLQGVCLLKESRSAQRALRKPAALRLAIRGVGQDDFKRPPKQQLFFSVGKGASCQLGVLIFVAAGQGKSIRLLFFGKYFVFSDIHAQRRKTVPKAEAFRIAFCGFYEKGLFIQPGSYTMRMRAQHCQRNNPAAGSNIENLCAVGGKQKGRK